MASNLKHIKLQIGGMTCIHCQSRIEQRLRATGGVVSAAVSYQTGDARISYDADRISYQDIIAVIEQLDYQVLPEKGGVKPDFVRMVGTLIIIVCLYVLLEQFGVLNLLVPGQLAQSSMGYGMLFVTGLITSVHCIAMCGGINLSQCLPRETEDGGSCSTRRAFLPALLYNLGRVGCYTVTGLVLGLAMLSQGASLSGLLQPGTLLILIVALCVLAVTASIPFRKKAVRTAALAAVCAAEAAALICGSWVPGEVTVQQSGSAQAQMQDGVQVVRTTLLSGSYPDITVEAGTPVEWIVDAPEGSVNGCNYKLLLREFDVEYVFQTGENIITFTPMQPGTYPYSCWMGMIRGTVHVTDAQ